MIYLGKQGSFTTREGLKIAYLSGVQARRQIYNKTSQDCRQKDRKIQKRQKDKFRLKIAGLQANELGEVGDCNYSPTNLQALEANLGWSDPR